MKTTAEKSHSSSIQKKQQQPFLPKVGQPGFVSAASVQAKLTVNTPGDEYEKEADDTAEQVMRMDAAPGKKETPVIRKKMDAPQAVPVATPVKQKKEPEEEGAVQRQEEEEEMVQMQPEEEMVQMEPEEEETIQRQEEEEEMVQMQPEEDEETLQRVVSGGAAGGKSAPPAVGKVLSTSGTRMGKSTRTDMEGRFGTDFSGVRIHTDQQAADSAKSISAKAYTFGNHIVFNGSQYAPHTKGGKKLLAHELTHVVQQGGEVRRNAETAAPPSPETTPETSAPPSSEPTSGPSTATAPESLPAESPPPPPSEPSAEEVPVPEAPAPAEAEQAAVIIEPIMPEPPLELSEEEQQRVSQARANTRSNAESATDLPSEAENTASARAGVTEPPQETAARASGALVAELGQQPQPSPEIEEICNRIHEVIAARRPPDEDALLESDPEAAADEAGAQMNSSIESDADQVQGNYEGLEENPEGSPEQVGQPIETQPENVDGPNINATQATPDAIPEEEVNLDADVEQTAGQMEQAGMATPAAEIIQDGPVAEARAAHGELAETAETDPAEVLAEQDAALEGARGNMAALQEQALQALQNSRSQTVGNTAQQQGDMVATEEQMRTSLGEQAEALFTGAQEQVETLLEPLSRTAMDMWNAGRDRISTEFEQDLARVQGWIDDRHSGFGGGLVEIWDNLTGYPDWITDAYNRAERNFGDSVCDLIREISIYVNGIILTCEQLIDNADTQIAELFANAPADQAEWAAQEQERFRQRLNGLREQVASTQQNINQGIVEEAASAVQEARQRIHELRQKARGLIGRVADAINEFLEDPLRAIINGLLSLVGIEPSRFWALIARIEQVVADIANDPLGFAENLLAAIGAGFERFFDNFLSHLFQGFIDWLFSGLGAVGVQIPQDLSLSSIITFFLQLMGITWERIRMLLARHIGEENVALLEQAFELISNLIELGPQGIFEMLREQLDPQAILDTVINMAVEFVRDALITQITARILMMFNPIGAIAQAIEAIYRVLKWIFENAARIFSLVETVVNGMADIIAGNISGMAAAVETALARLLVPVIDFFMEFAHLGDLPEKVADTIRGLQEWVEGILDRVIGWLADRARSVLAALGIGGDEESEEEGGEELEDTEVGEVVRFTADGDGHRLWVDESGPTLMMASETKTVSSQLSLWQNESSPDTPPEADAKLSEANELVEETEQKAAETKEAIDEAEQLPEDENNAQVLAARTADDETAALERQLSLPLGVLIEAFEGEEFETVERSIPMHGGTESLSIENNEGQLIMKIGGEPAEDLVNEILSGALAQGPNAAGINFVRPILRDTVLESVQRLETINLNDGKISEDDLNSVNEIAEEVADGISSIGRADNLKIPNLERAIETEDTRAFARTFYYPRSSNSAYRTVMQEEFRNQLANQQRGLNGITIAVWTVRLTTYKLDQADFDALDRSARDAVLENLRQRADQLLVHARSKADTYQQALSEIQSALSGNTPNFAAIRAVAGRFGNETTWRRDNIEAIENLQNHLVQQNGAWAQLASSASNMAVLHNPDQIAGGEGEIPEIPTTPDQNASKQVWDKYYSDLRRLVGAKRINSSIGSQWKNKIDDLRQEVTTEYVQKSWAIWKLNLDLQPQER